MRIPTMIRSRPFGHHPRSLCVKSLFLSQLRCFVGCFFFPFLSGVNKKPHHFISSALSGSCITTCFLSEICFYCYALQINTADMFNWMTRFQSRLLSTKCPFFIFREEKKKKKCQWSDHFEARSRVLMWLFRFLNHVSFVINAFSHNKKSYFFFIVHPSDCL